MDKIQRGSQLCTQISSNQAFRFPNANNNFYFRLSVKDTNLKPDILDPIKDTLEVELGKVGCVITLELHRASGSRSKCGRRRRTSRFQVEQHWV